MNIQQDGLVSLTRLHAYGRTDGRTERGPHIRRFFVLFKERQNFSTQLTENRVCITKIFFLGKNVRFILRVVSLHGARSFLRS
jgi:hypothetical protein